MSKPIHPVTHSPIHGCLRGLTLIEILLSIVILSSAVTIIMQAMARSVSALHLAQHTITAYAFANAKLADVELELAQQKDPSGSGSFREGRDLFRWSVDVVPWVDSPGVEHVSLTVMWTQRGQAYTREVAMLHRVPLTE